jgi:hypothetical protein
MALLVITINDPGLDKKSAEVAYAKRAVDEALKEFGRGNGTITSGTIQTYTTSLNSPTSLGSWTYTPSAPNP